MTPAHPSITTKPLSAAPEWLEQVAAWHHQECERQGLTSSYELRLSRLKAHLQLKRFPYTLLAFTQNQLIGCVSLVQYHLQNISSQPATDVPVWLSNLYIERSQRKKGLGEALISAVLHYLKCLGYTECWLTADECTAYYQKRGWQVIRQVQLGGKAVNVMQIKLTV